MSYLTSILHPAYLKIILKHISLKPVSTVFFFVIQITKELLNFVTPMGHLVRKKLLSY